MIVLAARQTYTLGLCPPEIIEACKETTGNIHGNEGVSALQQIIFQIIAAIEAS